MLNFCRLFCILIAIGLGVIVLPGCGKRYVTVSGTVVLASDVKITDKDLAQIIFVPETKGEKAGYAGFSSTEKSFVCKDIAPGAKYKIAAKIDAIATSGGDEAKRAAQFTAFNKTFEPNSTTLSYQASDESSQTIAIDFAKGTVTVTVTKK